MQLGRLHVITDTRPGRNPVALARTALEAGAPTIQVRAKSVDDRRLFELAEAVQALCVELDGLCIVDNRADVALAVGAAGVHVGRDDLPVSAVRRVVGPELWVGATARHPERARELEEQGAGYLGVGPAYGTSTKEGLPAALGPEGIAKVAEAVSIPVIAVGGITADRVPELLAAGAFGVAVVSAISEAPYPQAATRQLLAALEGAR